MKLKVAVISEKSAWSQYVRNLLENIFFDKIEVQEYNGEKNRISEMIQADLILVASPIIYYSSFHFLPQVPTVQLTTTLTNQQYATLEAIPAGTQILVVNDDEYAVADTISLFRDLGLTHLEYYPHASRIIPITAEVQPDIAVTPGEPQHVPSFIRQTIDIGSRVISAACITEIAVYLGLDAMLKSDSILSYFATLRKVESSLNYLLDHFSATTRTFLTWADTLDEGMLITDSRGIVQGYNKKAANVFSDCYPIMGAPLSDLLPYPSTQSFDNILKDSSMQLSNVKGINVSFRVIPVETSTKNFGTIVQINDFEKTERQQATLRRQMLQKGFTAKNTFENIITQNADMLNLKQMAKKHAKTTSTILITGESGTGKEVLAQAIHNFSNRRSHPFVALNCAAMPKELLESELFGYVEGAFTGAKKGGKIGMFELSNFGTIFLDEIGDMDINLQARILRVLEEREVIRIGDDTIRPIDIRIIAATNQDLRRLVTEGKFRRDLYYRLNVIPLELKPLRQRTDDVLLLLDYFKKQKGLTFSISPQAEYYLVHHPWYGNVRELKNLVDYLSALDITVLDVDTLCHATIIQGDLDEFGPSPDASPAAEKPARAPAGLPPAPAPLENEEGRLNIRQFCEEAGGEALSYYLVMDSLAAHLGSGVSRSQIVSDLTKRGYEISEVKVRKIIVVLSRFGYVVPGAGQRGSRITPWGVSALEMLAEEDGIKKVLRRLDK